MDIASVIGIIMGTVLLIVGMMLEGDLRTFGACLVFSSSSEAPSLRFLSAFR